jgi:Na+-translocating ferredoxin:NAD+ oxidoreductase subunit A
VSYLGIVVTSLFASNALLTYGLGSLPEGSKGESGSFPSAVALACVNALASAFLWSMHTLVLAPLGLPSLDILLFIVLALPLLRLAARAASASGKGLLSRIGSRADDLVVGSLVFGVAFIASRSGFTLSEALAASAASGIGYWLAEFLLESLRERLDLSDLPFPFKGAPAMLISAGLMSLAFMGIDAAFVKNLAG